MKKYELINNCYCEIIESPTEWENDRLLNELDWYLTELAKDGYSESYYEAVGEIKMEILRRLEKNNEIL